MGLFSENGGSAPAASAGVMAAVRIATMMLGPYAIAKGWVQPDQVDGIVTAVVTFGVAGYGLFKTVKRQKKLNTAEDMIGRPIPPR